jgi:IMP dehydrogenase
MVANSKNIIEAVTFDDVLLKPAYSEVLPTKVQTKTFLTPKIQLGVPLISAAMDTVTESRLAIAMAQNGGIGCLHKNMAIEAQANEVRKIKKYESGMVVNPITIFPDSTLRDALDIMEYSNISGIPVIDKKGKLVGIITNRDVRIDD